MEASNLKAAFALQERRETAIALLARVRAEPLHVIIGERARDGVELTLTPHYARALRNAAITTLETEITDAADKLRDLGVTI